MLCPLPGYSRVIPASRQAFRLASSHREDCTSPMWALGPFPPAAGMGSHFDPNGRSKFALEKFSADASNLRRKSAGAAQGGRLGKAHIGVTAE